MLFKYGSATQMHDKCCPHLSHGVPFPLCALHVGRKRNSGRLRTGNIKRVYRLFLQKKQRTLGSLCVPVCECVCLIFNFPRRKKSCIFDLFIRLILCLCPTTLISKTFPLCIPLRLYSLIICIWFVFLYQMVFLLA